jgi:DHA2 family multidrug resistance protein
MDGDPEQQLTPTRRFMLTIGLMLATGLQFIDGTIVAVVLNHMRGSLSATPDQISWVATAYLVTAAMFMPLAGWLSGYVGRRRMMVYGVLAFTVLSALCGASDSLGEMIPIRIVLGLCGAILVPLSQAALLDIYPREKAGVAIGLWGIATTLGPAMTPILGGYLAETYSWRWAFYSIAPFGALSFIILLAFLPEGIRHSSRRFDFIGFILLTLSVGAFQLMINRGEREDWFDSIEILAATGIGITALYMFIVHSAFARQPFLNFTLFKDRNYVAGLLLIILVGPTQFVIVLLMPMLVQIVHGYPVLTAGIIISPRGFATILSMAVAGWLSGRVDSRILLFFGFSVTAASNYAVAFFGTEVELWDVILATSGQGLGMGFTLVPLGVIAYSTLPPALRPEASAFFNLMRGTAGAVSVAALVAVLTRTTQTTRSALVEHITPLRELLNNPAEPSMWGIATLKSLAALDLELTRQATLIGFQNSFIVMLIIPLIGLPLTLMIGKSKSAKKS